MMATRMATCGAIAYMHTYGTYGRSHHMCHIVMAVKVGGGGRVMGAPDPKPQTLKPKVLCCTVWWCAA